MINDTISWACRQGRPWLCREDMACSKTHDRAHQAEIRARKAEGKKLWDPNDWYTDLGALIVTMGAAGLRRGRLPRDLKRLGVAPA